MKHLLTEQERRRLDERVAAAEKRTGAQIVLALVRRSDVYAELPWKAFAIGAGLAGLAVTVRELLWPTWITSHVILFTTTAILGSGALVALLCTTIPAIGRLLLDSHRADTEVRQYAESLFLSRQVFATSGRTGVLLLISLFERKIVILPDAGLAGRLPVEEQEKIISRLAAPLGEGKIGRSFEEGLAGLEEILGAAPPGAAEKDELPNDVIEEEGA